MFSEVAEIARAAQFQQLLETRVILIVLASMRLPIVMIISYDND